MVYLRLWRLGLWYTWKPKSYHVQFKTMEGRTMDKELDYFKDIDLSNEFEPVAFSIEDYDPEELDKLIDKLNDELETALEKAEKQSFND